MLQRATNILILTLVGTLFAPNVKVRRRSFPLLRELRGPDTAPPARPIHLPRHAWADESPREGAVSTETPVEPFYSTPPSPRAPTRRTIMAEPQTPAPTETTPSTPTLSATTTTYLTRPPAIERSPLLSARNTLLDANPSIKPTHRQLAPDIRVPRGPAERFMGFDLNPSFDDRDEQSLETLAVIERHQARSARRIARRIARDARQRTPINANPSDNESDTETSPRIHARGIHSRSDHNPSGSKFADENPQ